MKNPRSASAERRSDAKRKRDEAWQGRCDRSPIRPRTVTEKKVLVDVPKGCLPLDVIRRLQDAYTHLDDADEKMRKRGLNTLDATLEALGANYKREFDLPLTSVQQRAFVTLGNLALAKDTIKNAIDKARTAWLMATMMGEKKGFVAYDL